MSRTARLLLVITCSELCTAFYAVGSIRPFHSNPKPARSVGNSRLLNRFQKPNPDMSRISKYEALNGRERSVIFASTGPVPAVPPALERKGTTPMAACVVNLIKNIVRFPTRFFLTTAHSFPNPRGSALPRSFCSDAPPHNISYSSVPSQQGGGTRHERPPRRRLGPACCASPGASPPFPTSPR
jgi:hypothetical protein